MQGYPEDKNLRILRKTIQIHKIKYMKVSLISKSVRNSKKNRPTKEGSPKVIVRKKIKKDIKHRLAIKCQVRLTEGEITVGWSRREKKICFKDKVFVKKDIEGAMVIEKWSK